MKDVIITSGDIKKNYEILGVICCERRDDRNFEFAFEDGVDELREKCLDLDGDAIIYFSLQTNENKLRFYGTAVKIM